MGTWGEGLYDNDAALDLLADLVGSVDPEESPTHLSVGLGLRLWMLPVHVDTGADEIRRILDRKREWLVKLPAPARAELMALAVDPKAMSQRPGSRIPEHRAIIGGYENGPRVDALLEVAGATELLGELAERLAQHLDEGLDGQRNLYEVSDALAALGVLLELRTIGVRCAPDRIARWKEAYTASDRATGEERSFWDAYSRRVLEALKRLG